MTEVEITKVTLTDFDKKRFDGQYKKVFNAFNFGLLGFTEGACELNCSGERDENGNYILLISEIISGENADRLNKIKGITVEEIFVDSKLLEH